MRTTLIGLVGALAVGAAVTSGALFGKADPRIRCTFAHRPSVTKETRLGPVVQLSNSRRTVRGRAGAFAFRATIGAESGEPGALSIRVQSRSTGKPVASGLYQFLEAGPSNQFDGGHGFTGLVYAYLPSGAELQYFCRAL
jgi:hypothetical protein